MNKNLVSIIIPTFNRAHLIGETLDSVIAQTYNNWECIVVDDGSTDYTDELLDFYTQKDSRIQYHHRAKDLKKGANACRNYGFEISKGEYVNWFDSDDLMSPNFLTCKSEILSKNEELDIVISKTRFIDFDGNIVAKEKRTTSSKNLLEDFITLKISWYLPDPMYRKCFLKGKTLFNEKMHKEQDRDLHIRLLVENPNLKILDTYLTSYRQSDQSISKDFTQDIIKSNYFGIDKQINLLLENEKMTNILRFFYLKQQLKKYPYLHNTENATQNNYNLFWKVWVYDKDYFRWFIKFSLAVISYKLTNRGHVFLEGK